MNIFKKRERFELLAPFLSKHMGLEVKLTMLSYGNIIEIFKNDEIDGLSSYQGYIFTSMDNNIRTFSDMKGKSLALVYETTDGFVFPRAWVKQHGVDEISKYLGEQFVSGGHDRAISSVLNGKADIGTAKSTIYNNMPKWQPWINSELVVLDQSSTVLSNTLCVSAKLDQLYKDQRKEPPLNMCGNPAGKAALKQLGTKRFIETYREQYQPVFKLAKEAGIDLEEYNFPRS